MSLKQIAQALHVTSSPSVSFVIPWLSGYWRANLRQLQRCELGEWSFGMKIPVWKEFQAQALLTSFYCSRTNSPLSLIDAKTVLQH